MKKSFNILGCCVSRDIIDTQKDKYDVLRYSAFVSPYTMLSGTPKDIPIEKLMELGLPRFYARSIHLDLASKALDFICEEKAEWLLIDVADIRLPIIEWKDSGIMITGETKRRQVLPQITELLGCGNATIQYALDLPIEEIKRRTEKVLDFIAKNFRTEQIILNEFYCVDKYITKDGKLGHFDQKNIKDINFLFDTLLYLHYHKLYYEYAEKAIDIIVSKTNKEIEKNRLEQLRNEYSIAFEKIYLKLKNGDYNMNDVSATSDKYAIFNERIEILKRGMQIAQEKLSYDNTIAYLIIYRHIGDAVSAFRKIKAIKDYYGETASRFHFCNEDADSKGLVRPFAKKKLIKKVIVIVKPSCEGVAKLFSSCIDGLIVLNFKDLDALAQYAYSACCLHQNIYLEADAPRLIAKKTDTDEGQWARMTMFKGISDMQWDFCVPEIKYSGGTSIPQETKERVEEYLKKENINIKKMILLCPVAQSSSMLDYDLWRKFADILSRKGFTVYTNVFGKELTVDGTQALRVGIDEVACLGSMGCKIIGVQSGLMDVLLWVCPKQLTILNVIKNNMDKQYALSRNATKEVNIQPNGSTYLRIEHFEEEYVLKLLEDNFH